MRRRELVVFPFLARAQNRPQVPYGLQVGDVTSVGQATVWARADRPGELEVQWSTTEAFRDPRTVRGSAATEGTGLTGRAELSGLPAGQTIFVRARFGDGDPAQGRFRTPGAAGDVRFVWSGDTCGQGYGINPEWGGMRIYETMRRAGPDFFLHSGDTIYADGPVPEEVKLRDGTVWRNVTTEAKSKAAETLDEFRGAYLYNLMDDNVRRFNAEVAQVWQWDDHETLNNWSPGKDLSSDSRYKEKSIATLAGRARQAFLEHAPMRLSPGGAPRIYRRIPYGPLLDVFVIDMRTYRAANSFNRQTKASAATAFLGKEQFAWLKRDLAASKAAWRVIASDMPIGLHVPDGKDAQGREMFEAVANGDGPALGRELEIADLLRWMKKRKMRNVVWLTADVHYTAAHEYRPERAQFRDFDPFWEFVSGPLNAGTFGPGKLDNTFGPEAVFVKAPPAGQANLPPSAGLQFFGEVHIAAATRAMTVRLRDVAGAVLYTKTLG